MALLDTLFGGAPQAEMLGGLLGEDKMNQLRSQATNTGLINAVIGYLAQPKNQRLGSALPYIARSLVAGQQGAQGVYEDALRNYQTQLQMSEMQRKQEQQKKLQEMIGNIEDPQERLFAQLAPEQYVTQKLKPRQQQAFAILSPEQAGAYGLPTDKGQRYQMTENGVQLIAGTEKKTEASPTSVQEYEYAKKNEGYKGSFEDWKKLNKQEGVTVNYGAPMAAVDAQGNPVFIQPSKTGGAPAVIPGFAPEGKAPTEAQAKAGAFGSQMKSASGEFERLQKEGFDPTSVGAQASTALAGTPFTMLADPKAQQANQAQQQWSEAYLRFKTGAAATEAEVIRNQRTFFPQFGDSPEVIAQKARMRKQAEQDVLGTAKQKPQPQQQVTQPKGLSVGQVVNGYRYKGGDPKDKNNWEKK